MLAQHGWAKFEKFSFLKMLIGIISQNYWKPVISCTVAHCMNADSVHIPTFNISIAISPIAQLPWLAGYVLIFAPTLCSVAVLVA